MYTLSPSTSGDLEKMAADPTDLMQRQDPASEVFGKEGFKMKNDKQDDERHWDSSRFTVDFPKIFQSFVGLCDNIPIEDVESPVP